MYGELIYDIAFVRNYLNISTATTPSTQPHHNTHLDRLPCAHQALLRRIGEAPKRHVDLQVVAPVAAVEGGGAIFWVLFLGVVGWLWLALFCLDGGGGMCVVV